MVFRNVCLKNLRNIVDVVNALTGVPILSQEGSFIGSTFPHLDNQLPLLVAEFRLGDEAKNRRILR